MATVIALREIWDSRGSHADEAAQVTRTRTFRATLDHPVTDAITVVNLFSPAAGIWRGSPYVGPDSTFDLTVRAVDLTADQAEDAWSFIVKVTYTSWPAGYIGVTPRMARERTELAKRAVENPQLPPPANPTARPITLQFGSQEYEEALRSDMVEVIGPFGAKKPVLNSAGDAFVPPPTRPVSFRTCVFERNELNYNALTTLEYENTVNQTSWRGFPPKTVLCKSITANLEVEGVYIFFRVTYTFWLRLDGWMLILLDAGLNQWNTISGEIEPILDKFGSKVDGPRPLDGIGRLGDPTDPKYLSFNRYPLKNFNLLNLGS